MNDEHPEMPGHFARAIEAWDEEADPENIWSALCEAYGSYPLYSDGAYVVEIIIRQKDDA